MSRGLDVSCRNESKDVAWTGTFVNLYHLRKGWAPASKLLTTISAMPTGLLKTTVLLFTP